MEWSFSLDNINVVANEFWQEVSNKTIIAFHGPMGSGKTTFIHALCDVKGVKDVVGSPTFSIINEYEFDCEGTKKALFHIDLYRLKDEAEAINAGVEDVLNSGNLCLVEWPEKAICLFPADTFHAFIEILDDKTRRLKIANI
jgi:tRNA threonylcarbamoyladenosine biosynthesis protein TsaE